MDPDETLALPPPHLLFVSITYYIAPSFPPNRIEELDAVLQQYGGNRAEGGLKDKKLTTVIANSPRWEGWEEVGEDSSIDVVTDKWVERSVVLGKLQLPQHFSTNPALLFSGVVACSTSDLPATDLEVLSAGIIALGGQWRTGLTKDVTHLFAMTPNSSKYATAMHYQETTRIKVLLPHWFDDTIRLGTGKLSTEPYEWPDVKMLKGVEGLTGGPEENKLKRNMYATAAIFTPGMAQTTPPLQQDIDFVNAATADQLGSSPDNGTNRSAVALQPGEGVWGGRKIILSRTLQLYHGRREAVQAGIERAGGVVLRFDGDEEEEETSIELPPEKGKETEGPKYKLHVNERRRRRNEAEKVADCDVLVTRWRFGRAYVLAVRSVKTIGTLAWLFHVQSTGVLSRPLDQLLHYPVPKRPIEAFHNHVITVTNYTGEAREYLKKLISAMGATFTPSMSGQNTALIAAYTSGTKATKARSWSIPVVNHTWLEDCFVQWRNLTPALEKYIVFPDGVDFATMLGERGVFVGPVGGGKKGGKANNEDDDRFEISKGRIELEAEELFTDGEIEVASDSEDDDVDVRMGPPSASEGLANGVEEAEVLEELGMDVDVADVQESSAPPKPTATPAKRASPTKPAAPKSHSTPTSKPKATPKSKPTPKPVKPAEEIIELESSSSEGGAKVPERVKATEKGKTKAKVIEEDVVVEEELPTKKSRPKPKPITKPTKPKPKPASESDEDEEQDEHPSKNSKAKAKARGSPVKKRLPISSIESGDESVAGHQEEEVVERPKKGPSKQLKRRFSAASVPENDDDEMEEEEEPKTKSKSQFAAKPSKFTKGQPIPPPASSSESEEEPVLVVSKPKTKPAKSSPSKAPSAPTKPTPKPTKPAKSQPVPPPASSSENESESAVVISKTKTNAKPKVASAKVASGSTNAAAADAAPTPSAKGLLNRVRGDARTRVKKRVSKGAEKKVVEVESEDEEDEAPKEKAKAKVAAKNVGGKKGKKALTASDSEEEDEDEVGVEEEEESEPSKPVRVLSSKSKPGVASTYKTNAKSVTTPTRKKPLRVYSENEEGASDNSDSKAEQSKNDEAEEVDEDFPSPHLAFSKTAAKSSTRKAAATSTIKSNPKSKGVEPTSTKLKSKSKSTKPVPTESESGTESDAPPPKKSTKAKDEKKTAVQIGSPSTPRRVMSVLMPTLSISGGRLIGVDRGEEKAKGKGKKRAVAEKENDEEEDGDEEEEEVTIKGKGKAKAKDVDVPAESVAKSKAKAKPKPSKPTSTAKVDSKSKSRRPPISSDEDEEEEAEVNNLISPRTRTMARTDSLRVVSAQVNIPAPSYSATAPAGKSAPKAKAKTKATPKVAQEKEKGATVQHRYRQRPPSPSSVEHDTPMDVDSHSVVSASLPASTSSVHSISAPGALPRRSAAAKATQKLHESIMPDVIQYEAQMKRSRSTKGRGSTAAAFVVEGDGGREKRDKEKEKRKHDDDSNERSKKRLRVSFSEGVEEPAEVEPLSKSKTSKGKQRAREVPMDVDNDGPNSSTKVRVMTTQVSLADDVSKVLLKLGVMFTTRPSECTHLLAQGVVRTEKFLCAVAMNSYILSESWAIASAEAKKLLPEEGFALKDEVGEAKYNVDLARALRLSKKNQGKLLQAHIFYVTPRVSIDTKLLKNVVNACGGQVTTQSPTLRIINASPENRHVISCKEDISIWRPLAAHGIKVYTQELVLEGVLRQEMDWDKESFLVKA